MTLWHIDDFGKVTGDVDRPWPCQIVGVLPTRDEYLADGDAVFGPHNAFCYTVSHGPTELWCPMESIEGRFCPPELIADVLNVLFAALEAHELAAEDNVIVPFEYRTGPLVDGDGPEHAVRRDAVFWVGAPTDDPDNTRFHCYRSPNTQVLPVRWSSPEAFAE